MRACHSVWVNCSINRNWQQQFAVVLWPVVFLSSPLCPSSIFTISLILCLCLPPSPACSCALDFSKVAIHSGTSEQVLLSILLLASPARWQGRMAGLHLAWTNTCPLCHYSQTDTGAESCCCSRPMSSQKLRERPERTICPSLSPGQATLQSGRRQK